MTLNLVADKVVQGKIYPGLARYQAEPFTQGWREFGNHYPNTIPFRPQEYCNKHGVDINIHSIHNYPANSYYPIGLNFFNFEVDYFALMSSEVHTALTNGLRVLFYYHEGDNPEHIKQRLDSCVQQHQLPQDCYVFVSGNTAAKNIPGFVYFADFELWFWHRNQNAPALEIHNNPRSRDFTALSRLHKSWRATVIADLQTLGILDNSYWSYCETGKLIDDENPVEIDCFDHLRYDVAKFLHHAPYFSDDLTNDQRNDHSQLTAKFFTDAYCNLVLETHFDADQSGGAFLTEKTFKPIKYGQPFFIIGCAGSLQTLRDLGYRVFDNVFDNSYDTIQNNTERWAQLRKTIIAARPHITELFEQCIPDLEHNQQLFAANKAERLNTLIKDIHESR